MEASLPTFLQAEAQLISEAAEALPHQFSSCTYTLGHIRQAVYLCLTCNRARGVCSSCSVACHTDHEQIELFPKRNFRLRLSLIRALTSLHPLSHTRAGERVERVWPEFQGVVLQMRKAIRRKTRTGDHDPVPGM